MTPCPQASALMSLYLEGPLVDASVTLVQILTVAVQGPVKAKSLHSGALW